MYHDKFHIQLKTSKRQPVERTTVTVNKCLSGLLAVKLKKQPNSEEAHIAVRKWIQEHFDNLNDPSRPYKSQWIAGEIALVVAEKRLAQRYNESVVDF